MKISEVVVEGLGTPYPGTYEQEFSPFKRRTGQRTMSLAFEDPSEEKITLDQLYSGDFPDQHERIWDYVGKSDFDIPFTVETIGPQILEYILCSTYNVEDVDELFDKMTSSQEEIISDYQHDPNLSKHIIVMSQDRIVDGNHRAVAAVLSKRPIKYIDVTEKVED